jgi:hypothetical protein
MNLFYINILSINYELFFDVPIIILEIRLIKKLDKEFIVRLLSEKQIEAVV